MALEYLAVMNDRSDKALILHLQANSGDGHAAFAVLYRRHGEMVRRVAWRYLIDKNHVDDVHQNTFVRFWKKRHRIGEPYRVKGYLSRLAHDEAVNLNRSPMVEELFSSSDLERISLRAALRKGIEGQSVRIALREWCEKHLDGKTSRIFILRFVEGLKYSQIAEQEKIPVGSVKRILCDLRKKLKKSKDFPNLFRI